MMRSIPGLVPLLLVASTAAAQMNGSHDAKIRNAMSAAPPSISANATIMDWPGAGQSKLVQLRAGTNGWTCLPDFPGSEGDDPQCIDATWVKFIESLLAQAQPNVDRLGVGYMIGHGGAHGSNRDPFATGPTPDNEWGHDPPHLMIVVPDVKALAGISTKRENGGPWVMWAGTPYAHLMVPLEPVKMKR